MIPAQGRDDGKKKGGGMQKFYKEKNSFVYILSNRPNGTIYVGVTDNLCKRVWQHKNDIADGFTKKYQIHDLVYYEEFGEISLAFFREKQLKKWRRKWKNDLIEKENANWDDLYNAVCLS